MLHDPKNCKFHLLHTSQFLHSVLNIPLISAHSLSIPPTTVLQAAYSTGALVICNLYKTMSCVCVAHEDRASGNITIHIPTLVTTWEFVASFTPWLL